MTGRLWACIAAVGLMLTTAACNVDRAGGSAAQQAHVLTFAQPNAGDPPAQLTHWAADVEKLTDGTVKIQFENGWRQGEAAAARSTLEDVRSGRMDLAWFGPQVLDSMGVTSFRALLAPMLVDSYQLELAVFQQGIPKEMLADLDKVNVVGVGVLPGPLRRVLGITSAFTKARDFVGKTIGIGPSALAIRTIQYLGATYKGPPFSTTLSDIDAIEAHVSAVTGNGYQAYAKALTANLNLWPRPLLIIAGKSAYDSLSPQQRQAMTQAVDDLTTDALATSRNEDADGLTALCGSGFPVIAVDETGLTALRRKLEPVYASMRADPSVAGFLDRINALKKAVGAPPDKLECAGAGGPAGAVPNGVYEHAVTPADVATYCRPDDASAKAFVGLPAAGQTLQLTVSGERLVESGFPVGQPALKQVGWTGKYRAYRNILELIEDRQTSGLRVTWSLDGNRLQLSDWPADDCAGEIVWTSHAWLKVSP